LLGKVKENKPLTRPELIELKRYERQAAAKIIAKAKLPAKPRAEKKKPKGAPPAGHGKKKAKKKKKTKKKKARSPIDKAEILRLGLECETRADATAAIRTCKSLTGLFRKYPELKPAWDRGRFMRFLRSLAKTTISISDAAKNLGFENGRALKAMFEDDEEIGELWNETRLKVKIDFDEAMFEEAKGGNAAAIKAVQQNFLLDEKEYSGADLTRLTINQLVEVTGRVRQTIHEWFTKYELPRNADKTFNLSVFLPWFEDFLLDKSGEEKVLDPYRAMKIEKLKAELARHRNETLDRKAVIIQLVAWAQHIVSYCNRHNEELSRLCIGQPREKVLEIHRQFFRDFHASIARVPKELHLSDDKEKELDAFLLSLKPENGGPDHGT
jgi:hypothetical protein